MKLSTTRIQRTLHQLEDQTAFQETLLIGEDSPLKPKLNELYGDHTFFLNSKGIHIVEPAETRSSAPTGKVIKLATWKDNKRTALTPHSPQTTDVIVVLGSEEAEEELPE